jgi:osmotically-inducible protein OsmY
MRKKTDVELQRDVIDELRWDPRVGTAEIGVAVRDGVVTLTGNVDSNARRYAAIHTAERVAGVKALADDLVVHLPTSLRRSDTEIAHAAANALKWNIEVPEDRVKVRVDDGWVILEGEVDWQFERMAAEDSVRWLSGVRGVTNSVTIKSRVFAPDVQRRIQDALKRSAEIDASKISVGAIDGRVTLRGKVRSWTERRDAESAAWAAPGVTTVEDLITVEL